ncbi:MAG: DsbC family protein [Burkholderiaceae bacterium]
MKSLSLRAVTTALSFLAVALVGLPAAIAQTRVAQDTSPAVTAVAPDLEKSIKERIRAWTGGRFEAQSVMATPMENLLEIRINNDLYYVDRQGRHILVDGELVDMHSNRNFTRERMEEVLAIDFSVLPIDKAIKMVNGNGERVVALFEDPNCTYCKRLRADLMRIDNLTVYTFPYPILAADSDVKSRKALCDSDPSTAWNDLMLSGQAPANDGRCESPIAEFKALGEKLGISATPTLFFPSGHRLQGYAPPTRFVEALDRNQAKKAGS